MNSSRKLQAVAKWLGIVTCLVLVSPGAVKAQEWLEQSILNQNQTAVWDFNVLLPFHTVLIDADPELGEVLVSYVGSKMYVEFDPVPGAVGEAEFVIEHFAPLPPPRLITSKFRVYLDSSKVVAEEDYFSVYKDSPDTLLAVLDNDWGEGGTQLNVTDIVVSPRGAASINSDGTGIIYSPEPGFTGMTYLKYVICDEYGACTSADANICVIPQGGFPLVDSIFLSTDNKTPVIAYLPTSGFVASQGPQHGDLDSVSVEAWSYIPDDDFVGLDVFTLVADTLTRIVAVDVVHQDAGNSYVVDDKIFTRKDSVVSFDVRLNDYKAFPIHAYSEPDRGTLSIDTLGVFTYTPETGYEGAVEFTYQVKPLNGLETGHVVIHVGDMPPDQVEGYQLTTPKNTPVLLNYAIPLDGYNMILTIQDPDHGDIALHNGYQDGVLVGCDTVEGYDMVVYIPDLNYVGTDYFVVQYCVDGEPDDCRNVGISVEVQEDNYDECHCVSDCVWPGDTDADGRVDMADLLKLGWHIGAKGPGRNYPNNSAWLGQYSTDWTGYDKASGMNLKYADSNGDGVLSQLDTQEITDHFLLHHDLIPQIYGLKSDYEFNIIPPAGALDSGDVAVFEIEVGSDAAPVVDMHGILFSLNLPTQIYQEGSVEVYADEESWLSHDGPHMVMHKEPWNGRLDVGFTRAGTTSASGKGRILIMTMIVVDDIDGFVPPGALLSFDITATNIGGMGGDGLIRDLDSDDATFFYRVPGEREQDAPLTIDDKLYIFPNPARDLVNVHLNGKRQIESLELYDMTGKLVHRMDVGGKHARLDVGGLATGTYALRVLGSDGVTTRKIQIVD